MDVVYTCRNGRNEELRYSLRSVAANLPHGKVWLFGGSPSWVDGLTVVPTPQDMMKQCNTERAIRAACEHPDVSDPFILFNDDFYVMQPVKRVPVLNFGTINDVLSSYQRKHKCSRYVGYMAQTQLVLELAGYPDPLSYELHVPMVFSKGPLLKVLDDFGMASGNRGLHFRSLYGNLMCLGGDTIDDVKVYGDQIVPQGPWLSSVDESFRVIEPVLRYLFPDPCRYEDPAKSDAWPPNGDVVLYAPVRDYTGSTAGIVFLNGRGIIPANHRDRLHLAGWFVEKGYKIGHDD